MRSLELKAVEMHGCGNSFIIVDEITGSKVSDKKKFVVERAAASGVDAVIFVQHLPGIRNVVMQYFDRDGTEEAMCGNGIRCVAKYAFDNHYVGKDHVIMTGDGPKNIHVNGDGHIEVNMGPAREFGAIGDGYFVNSSLAHVVYFRNELDIKEAFDLGRRTRYDEPLMKILGHPEGLHANFVKVLDDRTIDIMTYEVGVEDITKACGTGAVASAYVSARIMGCGFPIQVKTPGRMGDLYVDMKKSDLYLVGPAEYVPRFSIKGGQRQIALRAV